MIENSQQRFSKISRFLEQIYFSYLYVPLEFVLEIKISSKNRCRISPTLNYTFSLSNTGDIDDDGQRQNSLKNRGKLLLRKSCQAPAPMKDTFYLSIYQNEQNQIRIYADELKVSPSALSLSKSLRPG